MRKIWVYFAMAALVECYGEWSLDVNNASLHLLDVKKVCKKARQAKGHLWQICRKEQKILEEVNKGSLLATRECQYQFRHRKWNCTTQRKSLKRILLTDTRETAFVNAIVSAGITSSVTQGCTNGNLIHCTCDSKKKVISQAEDWEWGGCADNVQFGYRKSKQFLDSPHRKKDFRTLVLLHNYEAGRLAIKKYMRLECKCHGLSGSCSLRTCWHKMPPFREVGTRLRDHYDGSFKVIPGNDGKSIISEAKPHTKENLVYSENSPDFCIPSKKTGSLGTQGRSCNATSRGIDGCELLCCSRGHVTKVSKVETNCRCRFSWCCEVVCDTCVARSVRNFCK
uniref:Protein Wnt n=1 Tax=Thamnocephalus platyurus TaxID=91582 RepID=A0A0S1NF08_9CRUS|nr:Wnt6 ligand [Thamnocephalus platyurus]